MDAVCKGLAPKQRKVESKVAFVMNAASKLSVVCCSAKVRFIAQGVVIISKRLLLPKYIDLDIVMDIKARVK